MENLLNVRQAAFILKVHPLSVRRYIQQKKLKAVKVGGNVRIKESELLEFNKDYSPTVRNEENTIEIGLTDTVILYDLLTTTKVTGLKEKSFIFAKVLRQLAECSKIYQHYDNESDRVFKSIREWNMGLTNEDKANLAAALVAEGAGK